MKFENCKTCIIPSFLLGVAGVLLVIVTILFGLAMLKLDAIDEAKKELADIQNEYREVIESWNKIQTFSPENYQNGMTNRVANNQIYEALKPLKNIFIGLAIVETQNGSLEESLHSWRVAQSIAQDEAISNYGLGLAYFRIATELESIKSNEKLQLDKSIFYLSHYTLENNSLAKYHIALANLRLVNHEKDNEQKYLRAYKAIDTLKSINSTQFPTGHVNRNAALGYCYASKYVSDTNLKQEFKAESEKYFALVKDISDFKEFYASNYNWCMQ